MIELTSDNFVEEVVNSDQPVLLDFWAPWCGPCTMMTPVLEEISEECSGKVKFCKVNIEVFPSDDMPAGFSVSAIPTLMTVKNGAVVAKEVGLKSKEAIQSMIEEVSQ